MQEQAFDYQSFKISKLKKHRNFRIPILLLVLLIVALMVIGGILTYQNKTSFGQIFYFVQIKTYTKYSEASAIATEIQSMGAGGYIHYDGVYHVFAFCYPTKKEAKSVVENLKEQYPAASVFEVGIDKFKSTKSITNKQNALVKSTVSTLKETFNALYDTIIRLDKGGINQNQASINLVNISDNLMKQVDSYYNTFATTNNTRYNNAYIYLQKISSLINGFSEMAKSSAYSYELKQSTMKAVFHYQSLMTLI